MWVYLIVHFAFTEPVYTKQSDGSYVISDMFTDIKKVSTRKIATRQHAIDWLRNDIAYYRHNRYIKLDSVWMTKKQYNKDSTIIGKNMRYDTIRITINRRK